MGVLIVTGTGTDVGKTVVTAGIAALAVDQGLRAAVVKPAQTGMQQGEPGDLAEVSRLAGVTDVHEFARYPDPLSPEAAARQSGLPELDLNTVTKSVAELADTRDLVVVEGAGGLLVRFSADGWTLADLASALKAPLVLVVAAGLGTLNHTALTLELMASRGLQLSSVVIGEWPEAPGLAHVSNISDLENLAGTSLGGAMPANAAQRADFRKAAYQGLAPLYGGSWTGIDQKGVA